MPTTHEFKRAAEIEREIEVLVSRIVEAHANREDATAMNGELDRLSNELAKLRTPELASAA